MPDTSSITSRVDTGIYFNHSNLLFIDFKGLKRDNSAERRQIEQFHINDRVSLSKNRCGIVRYVGPTSLGSGTRINEMSRVQFCIFCEI